MLRSMRNGFFSAIFLGLLVLGGFSLVLTDWNGMFRGGGITKTDIAVVNGTPVKIAEFNATASRILQNQRIDIQNAYEMGLLENILQNDILGRILDLSAEDFGIEVEDKYVAEQIKDLIQPLKTAQNTEQEALTQMLQMQGMTEKSLVSMIRNDIETNILKSAIGGTSYVPDAIGIDSSSYQSMTRNITYIELANADIKLEKAPDDETLQTYYKNIETQYMLPEKRSFDVAIINLEKSLKNITISDTDIETYYNDNRDSYLLPEKRAIEQAIIKNESDAVKISDDLQKNGDLKASLRKIMGDDKAYSGVNSFAKKDLTDELSAAIFSAKKGDILSPIHSPLGFHIIKITDVIASHTTPLDKVEQDIKQLLTDEKAGNQLYEITAEIEDRLAAGDSFSALKNDYPIDIKSFTDITENDASKLSINDTTDQQKSAILKKVFSSTENEPTTLADLGSTSFYSLHVNKISPSTPRNFAEVKSLISKRWGEEMQARENLKRAQDMIESLNGKTPPSLKSAKKIILAKNPDNNKNLPDTFKDPRVLSRFLDAPKGKFILSIPGNADKILVGKVDNIEIKNTKKTTTDNDKKTLQSDMSTTNLMLLVQHLQKKYPVEINYDLLERAYGKKETTE